MPPPPSCESGAGETLQEGRGGGELIRGSVGTGPLDGTGGRRATAGLVVSSEAKIATKLGINNSQPVSFSGAPALQPCAAVALVSSVYESK